MRDGRQRGSETYQRASTVVEARSVSRSFGQKQALRGVSLAVDRGEVQALLGPNGAGKTTLLRVLSGFLAPTGGEARIMGVDTRNSPREVRRSLGLVPSGDRSFYLRISGIENLTFFARLHGLPKREAFARAQQALEHVDLAEAARRPVGVYSHGMQKRLSVARALLSKPSVLLVDEATHDLDPEASHRVRHLVSSLAERGTAVLWTTQRIDEIRSFAHGVTLLDRGEVRFCGSVPELMSHATATRYVLRLRNGGSSAVELLSVLEQALAGRGTIRPSRRGDEEHWVLGLTEGIVLGDALAALTAAEVQVLACREERSEIEDAFLSLTEAR
jgi:ABC-2 type transport system ATP-binding protein